MTNDFQAVVVEAMQNPGFFGTQCHNVELIETHISWVFLAGDYVYKVKKAVDFGFLDYSTLEKREHFCKQEIVLNRRLAPDLYIGVVFIVRDCETGLLSLVDVDESISKNEINYTVEFAVKMHRFDQSAILSSLMDSYASEIDVDKRLGFDPQRVFSALGERVAEFHLNTPVVESVVEPAVEFLVELECSDEGKQSDSEALGGGESIGFAVQQNVKQISALLTDHEDINTLSALKLWSQSEFVRLSPVFALRLKEGFVRECHGDLHTGNIAVINEAPLLFDCIEFNDQFRCIDVISEVAFLVMDLEFRGAFPEAMDVLNAYLSQTGDYNGLRLLTFYKVYRAMVRAKVSILRLPQCSSQKTQEMESILGDYRKYIQLANSYITDSYAKGMPSGLLLTHGVSGSGKTTAAKYLGRHWRAIHLRADVERKRLFGMRALESSQQKGLDIYTDIATKRTFETLITIAEQVLQAGFRVVIDSTFLHREVRERFFQMAKKQGVSAHIISCHLGDRLLRERIESRQREGADASEAGVSIMEQQKLNSEPLTPEELASTYSLDMRDPQKALGLILQDLILQNRPVQ